MTQTERAITYPRSGKCPAAETVTNWPDLLEQFDAREILHVTFGSVLRSKQMPGEAGFTTGSWLYYAANSEAYARQPGTSL